MPYLETEREGALRGLGGGEGEVFVPRSARAPLSSGALRRDAGVEQEQA